MLDQTFLSIPTVVPEVPVPEEHLDLPTSGVALTALERDVITDRDGHTLDLESHNGTVNGTDSKVRVKSESGPVDGLTGAETDRYVATEEELSRDCCKDVTALRYINVKPSDSDPYRGDEVFLVHSNAKESTDLTDSEASKLSQRDNSKSQTNSLSKGKTQAKENDCGNIFLTTKGDRPSTPLDHLLSGTPPRGGFLGKLKTIKRSSSVISDSGIESEPSSVAWPGVVGGRDPLHLCRRRAAHRSSLEGLQTESHGSLPSATQASLSSISSLPYEDDQEERKRQLNTLTKSASAPQINSRENLQEVTRVPTDQEQIGKAMTLMNTNHIQLNPEDAIDAVIKETEKDQSETSKHDEVGLVHLKESKHLEDEVKLSHEGSYDDLSFQQIQLEDLDDEDEDLGKQEAPITGSQNLSAITDFAKENAGDSTKLLDDSKEPKLMQGQTKAKVDQLPQSSLAFMNKKVVEVVNLSVSCAPTCLPFSSILRDSPSVGGISAQQAISPITNQPLGSFGIITSSTSSPCTDQDISERMLE